MGPTISKQALDRMPMYLSFLKSCAAPNVSATAIARALGLGQVQVRKDLACVSSLGRPKVGYATDDLIRDMESFLGYDNAKDAVIVGAGRLGRALMGYKGFDEYGLSIVAAFDENAEAIGESEAGKPILPMDRLEDVLSRLCVHIGIVTVPASAAQEACDRLIKAGALAIWNFAPTRLTVPEGVLVQNENMASSLAVLSNHLANRLKGAESV